MLPAKCLAMFITFVILWLAFTNIQNHVHISSTCKKKKSSDTESLSYKREGNLLVNDPNNLCNTLKLLLPLAFGFTSLGRSGLGRLQSLPSTELRVPESYPEVNTHRGNTSLKTFGKPIKKWNKVQSGERYWVAFNKRDTAILVRVHQSLAIQIGENPCNVAPSLHL